MVHSPFVLHLFLRPVGFFSLESVKHQTLDPSTSSSPLGCCIIHGEPQEISVALAASLPDIQSVMESEGFSPAWDWSRSPPV